MTLRNQGRKLTLQEAYRRRQRIAELLRQDWTHAAIAGAVGCARPTVTYYARTRNRAAA